MANSADSAVHGTCDDGVVKLQEDGNADAWITAEYPDGWWRRNLLTADDDEYEETTHPYLFQCAFCREFQTTTCWGADQPFCPRCEQWHEFVLPDLMAWIADGEELGQQEEMEI